ncbi:hypothetical protein AL064_19030 [Pseudomonas syringae pv. syringae]|uniref:Lar family restriction alleviation protein n=1 Tax=Pseudomonas syringae TaxID=317 RepID=UPI000760247E|nr:Lar family restriction alleviation protein [Pseudomonas syringae]KWS07505.1 hypothetical protein AL064_19030 [Pseudomonas syringae pv. syringae]
MSNEPNDVRESRELLRCPFCGGVPFITKHHREEMYAFIHRCEVLGPISRDFREDPAAHVEMWNTRVQPTANTRIVLPDRKLICSYEDAGFNECLDEVAKLNTPQ